MASKKTPKLRLSLVFSLVLHGALLLILALGAYTYTSSLAGDNGNSMNAIMVDPSIMSEQSQRRMKQKAAIEQREQQRQAQARAKTALLEKQKLAEQQRLKALERKRLAELKTQQAHAAAVEKKRAEEAASQAKARLAEQQQKARIAKQQAEAEQAKKAAEAATKAQVEKEKAQEAEDILGDLTSEKPAQQQGVKQSELAQFASAVQNAISSQFRNPGIYDGKSCVLKINIAPDGMLIDVETENATSLCREAELATKQAKLPRPSSDALYKKVKNLILDFRPQSKVN